MAQKLYTLPKENRVLGADLHCHVYFSPQTGLEWLLGEMKDKGIQLLSLTDYPARSNFELFTSEEQLDRTPTRWKFYQDSKITAVLDDEGTPFYLLKGFEFRTHEGHMVFGGYDQGRYNKPPKFGPLQDSLIDKNGPLLKIIPHPFSLFGGLRKHLPKAERKVDALEYSALMPFSNSLTVAYANEKGLEVVGNSDAHYNSTAKCMGKARTLFKGDCLEFRSGEDFIASVKDNIVGGNTRYEKGLINPLSLFGLQLHTTYHMLRRIQMEDV